MNTQVACMLLCCAACEISALDWFYKGVYSDAIAFGAFGIGYTGLAVAFWSTP